MSRKIMGFNPWEIVVSRVLGIILPIAKLANCIYCIVLLCAKPVEWRVVGMLCLLVLAIHFAHKNILNILQVLKGEAENGTE